MNNRYFLWGLMILFLSGCGKKDEGKKAKSYFNMAYAELMDEAPTHASYQQALQLVRQALDCEKKAEYYALMATLLFNLGDEHEAQKAFDQALALEPNHELRAQIMNNYACLYAQMGNRAEAEKLWRSLTTDSWYPTPEVAWVNLGKLYLDGDQAKKAEQAFATAATLSPSYLDAHFYQAVAAKQAGDVGLAATTLEKVLALEPGHQLAKQLQEQMLLKA